MWHVIRDMPAWPLGQAMGPETNNRSVGCVRVGEQHGKFNTVSGGKLLLVRLQTQNSGTVEVSNCQSRQPRM